MWGTDHNQWPSGPSNGLSPIIAPLNSNQSTAGGSCSRIVTPRVIDTRSLQSLLCRRTLSAINTRVTMPTDNAVYPQGSVADVASSVSLCQLKTYMKPTAIERTAQAVIRLATPDAWDLADVTPRPPLEFFEIGRSFAAHRSGPATQTDRRTLRDDEGQQGSAEPVRVRCSRVLAQRHPGECRLPDRSGVRRAETPG